MNTPTRQQGISLIELMIGIALGLMVVAALVTIVANTSRARNELAKTSQQIENGRYAIQLLTQDLHHAGFYGELHTGSFAAFGSMPDPCNLTNLADVTNALQFPIQGLNDVSNFSTWSQCAGDALVANSDVLAIRRAETNAVCSSDALIQNEYYIQASPVSPIVQRGRSAGGFTFGLHDPSGADTTRCKLVRNPDASCPTTVIAQNASGNCTNKTAATIRKFNIAVYYVAANNSASDGIPTLKRLVLGSGGFTVEPLVEGIQNMQIEYGIDDTTNTASTSFGSPDRYVAAPTLAEWPNVVAVRVHILARNQQASAGHNDTKTYVLGLAADGSENEFGPYNDRYKRHVFSSTVSLTNPAGRRNLP